MQFIYVLSYRLNVGTSSFISSVKVKFYFITTRDYKKASQFDQIIKLIV